MFLSHNAGEDPFLILRLWIQLSLLSSIPYCYNRNEFCGIGARELVACEQCTVPRTFSIGDCTAYLSRAVSTD